MTRTHLNCHAQFGMPSAGRSAVQSTAEVTLPVLEGSVRGESGKDSPGRGVSLRRCSRITGTKRATLGDANSAEKLGCMY